MYFQVRRCKKIENNESLVCRREFYRFIFYQYFFAVFPKLCEILKNILHSELSVYSLKSPVFRGNPCNFTMAAYPVDRKNIFVSWHYASHEGSTVKVSKIWVPLGLAMITESDTPNVTDLKESIDYRVSGGNSWRIADAVRTRETSDLESNRNYAAKSTIRSNAGLCD